MTQYKDFWPPGAFLKYLTSGMNLPRMLPVEIIGELEIHTLDLSGLKLNVSYNTPFIVPSRFSAHKIISAGSLEELLPQLHDRVRAARTSFVVLVVGGKIVDEIEIVQAFGKKSVALISRLTIEAVMNAPDRDRALIALAEPLMRYLGRHTLSPYRPGKPAHAGRFFGRVEALSQALSGGKMGGNFTIMGNRRIGKTSLLREIKARLLKDNARLKTADIYGNNFHSTHDVIKGMFEHLRPDLARRLDSEPQLLDNLPAHINQLPEKANEDVAVFIDELDHILEFDAKQGFKLLNLLRATFEHERCRIFFAGFRRVMEAKNHQDTPLYNFTQALPLTSLTKIETHEMIIGPFSLLGIEVSPGLPEAIMHETSGHPELVQMFCAKVVEYFGAHGKSPSPDALISSIVEDNVFRQTVYAAFLKNTNPIEQLSCYGLIARAVNRRESFDRFQFALQDIDEVLRSHGISLSLRQLNLLADNLLIGGVVGLVAGRNSRVYRFAVPRLGDYCIADDLNYNIRKTKEELDTAPGGVSIVMDPPEGFDNVTEPGTF